MFGQTLLEVFQLYISNLFYKFFRQTMEYDRFVYTVEELWPKCLSQCLFNVTPQFFLIFRASKVLYPLTGNVGSHHNNGIFKVYRSAISVCQSTVIEDLQ